VTEFQMAEGAAKEPLGKKKKQNQIYQKSG
jgi:hypothetical protein